MEHKLLLVNRSLCNMSGVVDVISFDTTEILLETDQGMLLIKGKDLHISRLSLEKGEIDVDGRLDLFEYSETSSYQAKGESFFKKLFR